MPSSNPPKLKKVLQIAFVVEDLYAALKTYSETYGLGPWKIYEISSRTVKDLVKHDNVVDFTYKVAMCDIAGLEWELVQPLDDRSIYADFLKRNGPGLHHVAFDVADYNSEKDVFQGLDRKILQTGNWHGTKFAHIDTESDLGFLVELFDFTPGAAAPEPDDVYPPAD
jgi:methylmalonyl-CoA/ethylmalonyl-CoA epimerase